MKQDELNQMALQIRKENMIGKNINTLKVIRFMLYPILSEIVRRVSLLLFIILWMTLL